MKKHLRRKPSASMLVAVTALILAASGTAVAASKLVKGDKLIAKRSLSGNRLRNHTITGTQVNLNQLGKVPSARNADNATTATAALNATNATNANNANTVGGQAPSAFDAASNWVRTGLVTLTSGNQKTIATFGPFTLTANCSGDQGASTLEARITATSSQPNADIDGTVNPTTPVNVQDTSGQSGADDNGSYTVDFETASGSAYEGVFNSGTDLTSGSSNQCFFTGLVSTT